MTLLQSINLRFDAPTIAIDGIDSVSKQAAYATGLGPERLAPMKGRTMRVVGWLAAL